MADNSFDIVSKIDRQEVDNALNQASKELSQRFDFKNTQTEIKWSGELAVELSSSTEERCKAALEVFKEKLIKRVSLDHDYDNLPEVPSEEEATVQLPQPGEE